MKNEEYALHVVSLEMSDEPHIFIDTTGMRQA